MHSNNCSIFIFILIVLSSPLLKAHQIEKTITPSYVQKALYIVPASTDLIQHSRFTVNVLKPYAGKHTQTIVYEFPEILVGEAHYQVVLHKVPGTINSWKSDVLEAHCTTVQQLFSCNIHIIKRPDELSWLHLILPKAMAQNSLLSLSKSLRHLEKLSLPQQDLAPFKKVVEVFFSHEPAGFLSYQYQQPDSY